MARQLTVGDVILVSLPIHTPYGHEQEGQRPAVVVATPPLKMRFPLVIIVPLTSQAGPWAEQSPSLYPVVPVGASGLPRPSTALIDQVRALDLRRTSRYIGSLAPDQLEPIRAGLRQLFSF